MKKIILVALLFLATLSLVILWRLRQAQPSQKPYQPPTVAVPPPAVPSLPVSQPSYTLAVTAPTFPNSLPLFTVASVAAFQPHFSELAKALGFSGDPKVMVGSRGSFSLWTRAAATLTVGADPIEIYYSSGAGAANQVAQSAAALEPAALSLFQKLGLSSSELVLSRTPVSYFAPSGNSLNKLPDQSGATLVQLNYQYLLAGRPLYARATTNTVASVSFNSKGEVVSLTAYFFPQVAKTLDAAPIADYQTAVSRLTTGGGTLASLSSESDINTENLPEYAVSASSINSVVLGYYYSPGETRLAPVYVFSGTGTDEATGRFVKTTTVVSALP